MNKTKIRNLLSHIYDYANELENEIEPATGFLEELGLKPLENCGLSDKVKIAEALLKLSDQVDTEDKTE